MILYHRSTWCPHICCQTLRTPTQSGQRHKVSGLWERKRQRIGGSRFIEWYQWRAASQIYCGRSAAFEAETPPETSRLIPIKINNASIYRVQISPRSPEATLCQTTSTKQQRGGKAPCVWEKTLFASAHCNNPFFVMLWFWTFLNFVLFSLRWKAPRFLCFNRLSLEGISTLFAKCTATGNS